MNEKTILQQCPECVYKATRKEKIKLHILKVHRKEFKFKCSQCPKQYAINSELSFHIQSCHKEKSLQCPHCNATYSVKKYLNAHIKLNHNPDSVKKISPEFSCTFCDFRGRNSFFLKHHLKIVHKDGSRAELICDECGHQELGENWKDFKKHLKTNHSDLYRKLAYRKQHYCPLCDKQFSFQMDMKRHVKAAHEGIKYNCDQCDFQSGYKNLLRNHIKRVHELYRHKCSICEELFVNSMYLQAHIQVKHEGLPYICQICNRPHILKKDLAKHLAVHHTVSSAVDINEIQEYQCESCQFQTTNRRLIKTHSLKFHKDLYYNCGHKKIHVEGKEEKPVCHICNPMPIFDQNSDKERRKMTDHKDSFPCLFCNFEMSQATDLRKHILSYHGINQKAEKVNIIETTL